MKIKSIKLSAPELTVDIEVADTHTYQLSNGCVSHNTTSKLFGLTEGAHLPPMREYMRWVQFRNGDKLIEDYKRKGYPVKKLRSYSGTTIVGFPTRPKICELDGGDWIVTASEATPSEQYQFLRLLEKYWIVGVDERGNPLSEDTGNQISYTLKYDPNIVDFEHFMDTLIDGQFSVKCCSVMPKIDTTAFEYQPEEPITSEEFDRIAANIKFAEREDIGFEHVDCGSGGCPVDFNDEKGFEEEQVNPSADEEIIRDIGFIIADSFEKYMIVGYEECPYCQKAKNALLENNIRYSFIEIADKEKRYEFVNGIAVVIPDKPQRTFPFVFKDGGLIGGYTELQNQLQNML